MALALIDNICREVWVLPLPPVVTHPQHSATTNITYVPESKLSTVEYSMSVSKEFTTTETLVGGKAEEDNAKESNLEMSTKYISYQLRSSGPLCKFPQNW